MRRCLVALGAVWGMMIVLAVASPAMAVGQQDQVVSNNAWANEYSWNWSDTVKSSLEKLPDNRYERVEWVSNALYVEHYSDSFQFIDSLKIDAATYTPTDASKVIWGGYFAGSDFNFVVTGQSNENDDDKVAVMRVAKYSKDWKYIGNVEYSAINTYSPFEYGSLRMAEFNGELWIRTCHLIYKWGDVHHQTNMTFRIRESDLAKLGAQTNVWDFDDSPMAYVAHSFNQFIVSTGSKIYSADHGDAYPRGIVAKDITPNDANPWANGQGYHIVDLKGKTGDNYTAATLGGFESAGKGTVLISAGSIADQDKSFTKDGDETGAKNIWIGVTPTSGGQSTVKYLTDYAFEGDTTATNPVLVKVNENRFLVAWSTRQAHGLFDTSHGNIQYAFIDGHGNKISQIYNMKGRLSDCQPIVNGNKIVWYATGGNGGQSSVGTAPTFYTIDVNNGSSAGYNAARIFAVSFDSNGGSAVSSQQVRYGSKVVKPADPTRSGYTFAGWYTAKSGGSKYDFNQPVTGDVTVYAHWTVNSYTLTFDANGGKVSPASRKVRYGAKYGDLPTPTRSGFTFAGWYTAKSGGSKVSGDAVMGAGDVTVYARWAESPRPSSVVMHRLYNRYTGEHFYTSDVSERDHLVSVGWSYEGVGWVAPVSGDPVYRLYNGHVRGGDHHYTTSASERDSLVRAGWSYEGVGWRSGGSVPVYRQYNPYARTGTHNYTADGSENDRLVSVGWRAEGVGWYAVSAK